MLLTPLMFLAPILLVLGFISLISGYKKLKNTEIKSEEYDSGIHQVKAGIIMLIIPIVGGVIGFSICLGTL